LKDALRSLLALVLLGGFLELLLPADEMRRYSRMVVGLLVLFSLMRLVITGIDDLGAEGIFRGLEREGPALSSRFLLEELVEEGERVRRAGVKKAGDLITPLLTERIKKLLQEATGDEGLQLQLAVTEGERITGAKIVLQKDPAWPDGTLERLAGEILGIDPERVEVEKAFARKSREEI